MKKNFDTLAENLQKNGFAVRCFDTAIEAAEYLDGAIDSTSVGFGGSMTLEKMGLYERLTCHNEVHWHQRISEGKTSKEVREAANAAKIYLTSANGVAES